MSRVDWGMVEWFLEDWRQADGLAFWVSDSYGAIVAKSGRPALCDLFCGKKAGACSPPCPYGLQQLVFTEPAALTGGVSLHLGGFYDSHAQREACLHRVQQACQAANEAAWMQAVLAVPVLPAKRRQAMATAANSFARLLNSWQAGARQAADNQAERRDALTGLYNRGVWEERLLEIEQRQDVPVAIIIGDIDGLKFVNETLGAEIGNRVLERTAALLRCAYIGEGLLARIGGDSFGLVCTGISLPEAEGMLAQLRQVLAKPYDNGMAIGMSFGLAFGGSIPLVVKELICEAQNAALQEKKLKHRMTRHQVVQQVVERLRAFDQARQAHPGQLSAQALLMGKAMGLTDDRLRKLALLLQYHDIGKAVLENVLVYHAAVQSGRDPRVQRQSASVGYRLALSLPDAAPVADLILKQHENWDGTGYPLGLAGEAIPLECRILAVVRQYDALCRNLAGGSEEEARAALQSLSGRQLDPQATTVFLAVLDRAKRPTADVWGG